MEIEDVSILFSIVPQSDFLLCFKNEMHGIVGHGAPTAASAVRLDMSGSSVKSQKMESSLDKLKQFTTGMANTGDFNAIDEYKSQDTTTNPILDPGCSTNTRLPRAGGRGHSYSEKLDGPTRGTEMLLMNIFCTVWSRNTEDLGNDAMVALVRHLIELYEEAGISKDRILIKLSSTWEDKIQAGKDLKKQHGIPCNMKLFSSLTRLWPVLKWM
ncbi:hypothetical protein A6R68_02949, partial [Neotoma lepida]